MVGPPRVVRWKCPPCRAMLAGYDSFYLPLASGTTRCDRSSCTRSEALAFLAHFSGGQQALPAVRESSRPMPSDPKSIPSDPMSMSNPGAPPVFGLRLHKARESDTKWLGEGEALVIGRNPTGVLSAGLPAGLYLDLFAIDDPSMYATHAIVWVSGGRPYVLCLRQGEKPTGESFNLAAQRDGEKSWLPIGEGSHDELHRNIAYIKASKDKRYALKVCPHRQVHLRCASIAPHRDDSICRWTGKSTRSSTLRGSLPPSARSCALACTARRCSASSRCALAA